MRVLNPQINLDRFFRQLSKSMGLLILDYDGTLAPFVPNPELALPYPEARSALQKLIQLPHTKVVVLSGRALKDLSILLKIDPLPELWGSHGGEKLLAGASAPMIKKIDPSMRKLLDKAAVEARQLAPELYCEAKPLSVALHWRGAAPKIAQEQSQQLIGAWKKKLLSGNPLELHAFDQGIELRLKGLNKAAAVKTLLEELPSGTAIAYLGDDFTDEEAFEFLAERALKVLVRKEMRTTRADIQLEPPEELFWFLNRWIESQSEDKHESGIK